MDIEVIKVAGSVLKDSQSFLTFLNLINDKEKNTIVVFSAFENVSANLKKAILCSLDNENKAKSIIEDLIYQHLDKLAEVEFSIKNRNENELHKIQEQILNLFHGFTLTKEINIKIADKILAYGEDLAAIVILAYFDHFGLKFEYIDSRKILKTDNKFGNAEIKYSQTENLIKEILLPNLQKTKCIFTQGFVATNDKNETTTMGFESSNLTATVIASSLRIKTVKIISKIGCIYNCDPELVKNVVKINKLSYEDSYILSKNGLKLLYPAMIELAKTSEMTIIYTNIDSCKSTIISKANTDSINREVNIVTHFDRLIEETFSISDLELLSKSSKDIKFMEYKGNQLNVFKIANGAEQENLFSMITILYKDKDTMLDNELKIQNYNIQYHTIISNNHNYQNFESKIICRGEDFIDVYNTIRGIM